LGLEDAIGVAAAFADTDNDGDADVYLTTVRGGNFLFENDGAGRFTDVSDRMPQFANNYEYEAIDLNGDTFLDLVTLNDGERFSNHIFFSDGAGGFVDVTADVLPDALTTDDNMVAFLDFDSDGDADVLVGNLGLRDRLLVNDGAGNFTVTLSIFSGEGTGGALGTAVADLNGDDRIDVVQAQGEVGSMTDHVFLGVLVAPDTAAPIIGTPAVIGGVIHARVHDNKSPLMPHDLASVVLRSADGETPMQWYGEYLWRGEVAAGEYQVCATDAAGNEACSDPISVS
ncbi:MAG: VCBS repeat-containing protein, partial [Acidobacteria bacterium]|nr:VCBS repeat-containing protein [Acidobacteriota bacterium]